MKYFVLGYIVYNFVIGAYSYWGPKAGYNIYKMVSYVRLCFVLFFYKLFPNLIN